MSTYRDLYLQGKTILEEAGVAEADLDARLLLEFVCGTERHDLLAHGDRTVEPDRERTYRELLSRRGKRIPLQQITGEQEFMGLSFRITENVLIPRQDTEVLVEEVLRYRQDGMHILDLCTGSGCILISLLHYSNDCTGVGSDLSPDALRIARENAAHLLEPEKNAGISWLESNLFEKIQGRFDLIVSNPPYIRTDVIPTLMEEVRDHEPSAALDGGEDGLFFYRKIVEEGRKFLNRGGMMFFEIGFDQAEDVSALMRKAGFCEVNTVRDFAGNDRVVSGTWIG